MRQSERICVRRSRNGGEMDNKHVGSWINSHVNMDHCTEFLLLMSRSENQRMCATGNLCSSLACVFFGHKARPGRIATSSLASDCPQSPLNHPVAVQDVLQHPYSVCISNAVALSIHCTVRIVKWMYIALNGGIVIRIHSSDLHSLLQSTLYHAQHNISNADDDISFNPAVIHTTREFVLPHLFIDGGGGESLHTGIVLSDTQVRDCK